MAFTYFKDGKLHTATKFEPTTYMQAPPTPSTLFNGTTTWHKYEINTKCYNQKDFARTSSLLSNLINCTPHALNYFYGNCDGKSTAMPAFRLEAGAPDFFNRFRPGVKNSQQDYGIPIRVFNQNTYLPLVRGTREHETLEETFRSFEPSTILIMSVIGANYIIGAINDGLLRPSPHLMILSPNSSDSVRDGAGNMIGVKSFTVIYRDGRKVDRE